jgi:hypothetical protein
MVISRLRKLRYPSNVPAIRQHIGTDGMRFAMRQGGEAEKNDRFFVCGDVAHCGE